MENRTTIVAHMEWPKGGLQVRVLHGTDTIVGQRVAMIYVHVLEVRHMDWFKHLVSRMTPAAKIYAVTHGASVVLDAWAVGPYIRGAGPGPDRARGARVPEFLANVIQPRDAQPGRVSVAARKWTGDEALDAVGISPFALSKDQRLMLEAVLGSHASYARDLGYAEGVRSEAPARTEMGG